MHLIIKLAWFFGFLVSFAAGAEGIPSQVKPGVLDKQFEEVPKAQSTGRIIVPSPAKQNAPDMAEVIRFKLQAIDLYGHSAFSSSELSSFYDEFIGQEVSLATVFAVANRITKHYADAGYALSLAYVPAQEIDESGVVRLLVVEGRVDEVIYTGQQEAISDRVKRLINQVKDESPLTVATLERTLLLADETPGLTVRTTIDRANEGVGRVRLIVKANYKAVDAFASLNNRGSRAIGPTLAQVSFTHNKLGSMDGRLTASASHTVGSNEMAYYALAMNALVNTEGTSVDAGISLVDAEPGVAVLRTLEYFTNSWHGYVGVTQPLLRSRARNATAFVRFDSKDSKGEMLSVTSSDERLRSLRIGGRYDWIDASGAVTLVAAQLSKGVSWFGGTSNESTLVNRADADFEYSSVKVDVYRTQPVGGGAELFLSASAQRALDPLPSSEQCGFGGEVYGRAFDSYEIAGDHCLLGLVELRKTFVGLHPNISDVQPYGYYDLGNIWTEGKASSTFAHSVGGGVRARFSDHLTGYAEVAIPIARDVELNGNRKARLFVGVQASF